MVETYPWANYGSEIYVYCYDDETRTTYTDAYNFGARWSPDSAYSSSVSRQYAGLSIGYDQSAGIYRPVYWTGSSNATSATAPESGQYGCYVYSSYDGYYYPELFHKAITGQLPTE